MMYHPLEFLANELTASVIEYLRLWIFRKSFSAMFSNLIEFYLLYYWISILPVSGSITMIHLHMRPFSRSYGKRLDSEDSVTIYPRRAIVTPKAELNLR
jgi:hypothetical protein